MPQANKTGWIYASLVVIDGHRRLKPSHVCYYEIGFREPPRIESTQVEIILTNGDEEQRHFALVLPHDPAATVIPIQLGKVEPRG